MKLKQKLSVMLIVAMIASLFAGTSIGIAATQKRSEPKASSSNAIFDETPVVLVTNNGKQIPQKFNVASDSNAVLDEIGSVTKTPDSINLAKSGSQMVITPNQGANPGEVELTLSIASPSEASYKGKVMLQTNWFDSSTYKFKAGVANEIKKATNATSTADSLTVKGTSDSIYLEGQTVQIAEEVAEGSYELRLTDSNGIVVGLTTLNIDKADPIPEIDIIEDTSVTVKIGEGVASLSLTDAAMPYKASLTATSSNAAVADVAADQENGAILIEGRKVGETTATVTIVDTTEGKTITDEVKIIVEISGDKQQPLFTADKLTMVLGTTKPLPIDSKVWADITSGKAVLKAGNPDIVAESEKDARYITAKAAGTTQFTIEYVQEGGSYPVGSMDMLTVEVIKAKGEKFFKESSINVEKGKTVSVELTEKAAELLEEEDATYELSFDQTYMDVTLDEVSDPIVVDFTGIEKTETALTVILRIGDFMDTCDVKVVPTLEEIVGALDEINANSSEGQKAIKEAVKTIIEDLDLNKTVEEMMNSEDGMDYEAMEEQMAQLQKVEELIIQAFGVEVEPAIEEAVKSVIGDFKFDGAALSADLSDGGAKDVKLEVKSSTPTVNSSIKTSPNAVGISIQLFVGGKDKQPSAPIRANFPIPAGLLDEENLVIYHIHNGKPEKIYPYNDGSTLTFYITKLSKFVIDVDDYKAPSGSTSSRSGGSGGGKNSYVSYTMHGSWSRNQAGNWVFRKHSGSYAANEWGYINGAYYYFDANGNMMTGWVNVNNQWYYLDPTEGGNQGRRVTGWAFDPAMNGWFYLDNSTGVMLTGWQQIEGKWYYLNPVSDGRRGVKAVNQQIDGYYVDANGVRQ